MSSREWSAYIHESLAVPLSAERISSEVAGFVDERYAERLPLSPGARQAVLRLAHRWSLGLASSSNRTIIDRYLDTSSLRGCFAATVSSEEVERGKPAPDVYLAAADHLGAAPPRCVAIEDSTNGIGTPRDVTLQKVRVELFHPADDTTRRPLRRTPPRGEVANGEQPYGVLVRGHDWSWSEERRYFVRQCWAP